MKSKFAIFDLCAVLHDLRQLLGMRVVNVYDINSKTYLLKLQRPNEKVFVLFESGIRIHTTSYDWPKSTIPSGFSMKFRKHINSKRLTAVGQVGADRIVDLKFGDEERSCHVLVELYDRGNVVLTDHDYQILNILRPRTDQDADVRIAVRERYPLSLARQSIDNFLPSPDNILLFLQNASEGDLLRKSLARHVPFGALLIDHSLTILGIPLNAQIGVHVPASEAGAELIGRVLAEAARVSGEIAECPFGGFIAYEEMPRNTTESAAENGGESSAERASIQSFKEYYPYDFAQFRLPDQCLKVLEFGTFSEAVDKFYSSIEAQKAEQRILVAEREADKKLQNIRRDHENRIQALEEVQQIQERRGELILLNRELVEKALLLMRVAIANMSWSDIEPWLKKVAAEHAVARTITKLQLDSNRFTMSLTDPYEEDEVVALNVDIDIDLNADQNARRFFTERRAASSKQQKTEAASKRALKSAHKQVQHKVSQVKTKQQSVIRARKTYWFEKFLWVSDESHLVFISSDHYIVLAGRDAQQNELLVKRYMRPGDIYVHAEIQGAASVVIRNRHESTGLDPPPRTLNEAGTMAVCFSSAWEAGVAINAWWVRHDQVSRTAPTGEYLTAGAFMIRGKRNFLPPCQLQLGFGLMFKLDDESAARHRQQWTESEVDLESRMGEERSTLEEVEEEEKDEGEEQDVEEGKEDEFPDVQVRVLGIREAEEKEEEEEMKGKEKKGVEDGGDEGGEGEVDEPEEAGQDEVIIDSITARIDERDQLLFALPVCAPYTAMQRFKFKVKLTPGTFKRGKAVKQALDLFGRDKTLSVAERTLLKTLVGDDRITQLLPAKVRVSAPAMNVTRAKKHK